MEMSFPEMVSDSLCRNSLVVLTHSFISCLGGWSQTIPQVKKKMDVEVLGWLGYMLWKRVALYSYEAGLDILPNSLKHRCGL